MAWEKFNLDQQRLKAVQTYISGDSTMSYICKQYGISRKTGYKWVQRFLEEGISGLSDLSRARHTPQNLYSQNQIERTIDLKCKYLTWGPKKILAKIKELFPEEDWPSPTRLYEIFKEYSLVNKRRIKGRVPATAPLGILTNCNDTWSVDLKGWFLTGDGCKCEPLTITDNYTRYLIRCVHLARHSVEYVWPVFDAAFREYGLPNRVRSDNGPPFGSIGAGRLTPLAINLIKAGVTPEWIQPGHPEENGRHERFHLTLKQDTATPPKNTLKEQIQAINEFHHEYNFERPHEALDMKTPGSCYQPSLKRWDGVLRSPEYNTREVDVRKVCQSGCIWLKQNEYYISQSLTGEYVALKSNDNEEIELYYGPIYIGKLNPKNGLEKTKIKKRRQR